MKRYFSQILFFALLFVLLNAGQAKATAILELSFDQVCQGAELIFEGRVVSNETRPSPIDGKPFTYFTFQIIEVIKGSYPGSTIELGFMGGQLDGFTLKVSGMQMPEMGEKRVFILWKISVCNKSIRSAAGNRVIAL